MTVVQEDLFTTGEDPHLIGGRCRDCGSLHFPRTDTCPYCGSVAVEAADLPTEGRLWAWTSVTAAPPGYLGPVPYGFGVVELEGCIRVVTRLTEPDPGALHAGQPVHLVLDEVGDGVDGSLLSWAFAPDGP